MSPPLKNRLNSKPSVSLAKPALASSVNRSVVATWYAKACATESIRSSWRPNGKLKSSASKVYSQDASFGSNTWPPSNFAA